MNRPALRLQVGGTLNPRQHVYIERPEDAQVFDLLQRGEFVNVLSARQMGKSSLMARTMGLLRAQGVSTAMVDLAGEVGAPTDPKAFYRMLLRCIAEGLDLEIDVAAWWDAQPDATVNQQILGFFRDVVLQQIAGPVVVFLDEIDSTLRLTYTDDLFTTIRGIYNQRATAPVWQRLTFCLLGVATPNELIKDRRTTPYNVGTTVELRDFDAARDDLSPLTAHLGDDAAAEGLLGRVLHWTAGQPYLTTRLCEGLRETADDADVDRLVEATFTSLNRLSGDPHVQTILAFLDTRVADGTAVFALYKRILNGRREPDQQTPTHAALKLCGLVKRDVEGGLVVRNLIYRRLFDRRWVAAHTPMLTAATWRVAAIVALTLLGLGSAGGGAYYYFTVLPLQRAQAELLDLGAKVEDAEPGPGVRVILPNKLQQQDLPRAVDALARLGTVTQLIARSEQIDDIAPLNTLPGLRTLDLGLADAKDWPARTASSTLNSALKNRPELSLLPLERCRELKTLSLLGRPVTDVAPLRTLTNLQSLDLGQTHISSIEALRALTKLQGLDLSQTKVASVEPLRDLINLHYLYLPQTLVADIEPLRALINLQYLDLSGNQVADIKPLHNLAHLQGLYVAQTLVTDFEPLRDLINLQYLNISATRVTNVDPLRALTNLQDLNLATTQVANIEPLRDLINLRTVDFWSTRVADIESLRRLAALRSINLGKTQVANIEALRGLTALRSINLGGTMVADIMPLRTLTDLQTLYLWGTKVTNIEPVAALTALQTITLGNSNLADIEPLRSLTSLQSISLWGTPIANVEPLSGLIALQTLDLSQTQVTDISPLRALTKLQDLNLMRTRVADVSVLFGLTSLQRVNLTGTLVPEAQARRFENLQDTFGPR